MKLHVIFGFVLCLFIAIQNYSFSFAKEFALDDYTIIVLDNYEIDELDSLVQFNEDIFSEERSTTIHADWSIPGGSARLVGDAFWLNAGDIVVLDLRYSPHHLNPDPNRPYFRGGILGGPSGTLMLSNGISGAIRQTIHITESGNYRAAFVSNTFNPTRVTGTIRY